LTQSEHLLAAGHRLEVARIGRPTAATLVFLHEGLGCVASWRDFPARLAQATGLGALVYSRLGYGGSEACALPRPLGYMHDEARLLPDILCAASLGDVILVGHSDGASIALIHAGQQPWPGLRGVVAEAAHVFCEDVSVASIAKAAAAYRDGGLREKLARYHGANVDCAFWGWNRAWLDPAFRQWNIEEFLPRIAVPVLAIQGADDEYGTVAQLDAIARGVRAPVETMLLPDCGHAPHRDRPAAALAAMADFIKRCLNRPAGAV
jgi:pimeloyl-ACP methyl ester carboxylesterase